MITTPTAVKSMMLKYLELICDSTGVESVNNPSRLAALTQDYQVRHLVFSSALIFIIILLC